ncbi:hypothetical protein PS15p_210932 [Mucor circinelloides]
MSNNNNLGLYLIASPIILIVSCLVLVLPINAIMQWKHMLHDGVNFSVDMSNIVSYMQMIPSSWLILITSFFTCMAGIKYQLTFKKLCYNIHQAYSSLEFNFTGATNNEMPGSFTSLAQTATTATVITTTSTKKQHHKKPARSNQHQNSKKHTSKAKPASNTVPQITSTKTKILDRTPEAPACESEWVVYEGKKAKRSSLPAMSKAATHASPQQHCYSLEVPLTAVNTNVTKHNDYNETNAINLEKRKRLQIKSLLPLRRPLNYHDDGDNYDVPHLVSDNDTDSQASVESPHLASRDLPCIQQQPSYYSPFSTGFDFGVSSIPLESKDETKFYPSRLDEYLASQAPYSKIPSVNNISKYTPPAVNSRAYNILKLLNPSNDQIETTITPTAFRYFDEMLISNSLCTYQKEDDVFLKNKKEWNRFAR